MSYFRYQPACGVSRSCAAVGSGATQTTGFRACGAVAPARPPQSTECIFRECPSASSPGIRVSRWLDQSSPRWSPFASIKRMPSPAARYRRHGMRILHVYPLVLLFLLFDGAARAVHLTRTEPQARLLPSPACPPLSPGTEKAAMMFH